MNAEPNTFFSNTLLALSTFFMWLLRFTSNNIISILTIVVLIFTALNQFTGWRKDRLAKRKLEIELEQLEKIRKN